MKMPLGNLFLLFAPFAFVLIGFVLYKILRIWG